MADPMRICFYCHHYNPRTRVCLLQLVLGCRPIIVSDHFSCGAWKRKQKGENMVSLKLVTPVVIPAVHRIDRTHGFTAYNNDSDETLFCLIDDNSNYGMVFYAGGECEGSDFDRFITVEEFCEDHNLTLVKCFGSEDSFQIDILVKE